MNIENKKQVATILLAVGLGLVASMLMSKVVNDKIDEQTKLIAKEYKSQSAVLVKEIESTKKEMNKLSKDYAALAKKVAKRPIAQQQVTKKPKTPVQKTAFSLRTPPGKRALTMRINSLSAVGGLVNAGDFVDIIAILNHPDEKEAKKREKDKIISVLFQNIQVLAVGTNYDPIGAIPPYEIQQKTPVLNVTFAVSPEQASLLTFAQTNGELQLSLRSPAETQDVLLQQVASWDVLSDFVMESQGTRLYLPKPKPATVKKEEKEPAIGAVKPYVQIFRGGREL